MSCSGQLKRESAMLMSVGRVGREWGPVGVQLPGGARKEREIERARERERRSTPASSFVAALVAQATSKEESSEASKVAT